MALPVMMPNESKIALTIVPLKLLQQNHVHNLVLMMCNRILREDISLKLLASTASLHLYSMKIHHMILQYGRYARFYLHIGFMEWSWDVGSQKRHIRLQEYLLCSGTVFLIHGHIPPLARLLKTPSFTNSVGLFLINEGHHIVTGSQPHGNDPPHWPAYGKLL